MARAAFTLIEVLMIVLIIAILGAVVMPEYTASRDDAAVQAMMQDLRAMERAILIYHGHTSQWPEEQGPGKLPPELDGYLASEDFQKTTAVGGHFDWNYQQNGVTAALCIRKSHVDAALYQQVDDLFDDGNPKTGRMTYAAGDIHLILEP